jgi:hypothetical protein
MPRAAARRRPAARRSHEVAADHGRPRSEGKRKGPAKREGKVALWQVPRPVAASAERAVTGARARTIFGPIRRQHQSAAA